jgi:co-chaperonin GroES (HSP10)
MGEAAQKRKSLGLVSPEGTPVTAGPMLSHPVTRDGHAIPFFPVGKRVAVERLPPDAKIGGLHIPDNAQAQQQYATVIACGPAAQAALDDMGISIGDTICFGKHAGVHWDWEIESDGTAATALSIQRRRSVWLIDVGDILGSKELAEKMIDGRRAIMKRDLPDGQYEYRFFDEVKKG